MRPWKSVGAKPTGRIQDRQFEQDQRWREIETWLGSGKLQAGFDSGIACSSNPALSVPLMGTESGSNQFA